MDNKIGQLELVWTIFVYTSMRHHSKMLIR